MREASTISKIKQKINERLELVKTWDERTIPNIRIQELERVLILIEQEEEEITITGDSNLQLANTKRQVDFDCGCQCHEVCGCECIKCAKEKFPCYDCHKKSVDEHNERRSIHINKVYEAPEYKRPKSKKKKSHSPIAYLNSKRRNDR